jgi:hypothetical protein
MKTLQAISLTTAILFAGPATGFAAVGSEQAREANARNAAGATGETSRTTTPNWSRMSVPNVPSHDGNNQLGYSASPADTNTSRSGSAGNGQGVTAGPAPTSQGGDRPLGYAKGARESSK